MTMTVTLEIEKEDYADRKKEILKRFRREADIKGFRKGMAPLSLIEKMHGRSALIDAVNDVTSEGLNNFIVENKLNIIGEPLPSESDDNMIDFEKDESFSISFDLGLSPEVEVELSEKDKVIYYDVEVTDEELESHVANLRKQFGTLVDVESVEEDDFIIGDLVSGESKIEASYIALRSIADEEIKKSFVGKKVGDSLEIDVNKAFENESDRAALLKVSKEELGEINPLYTVTIKEIKRFEDAEENSEFYQKVFGEEVTEKEQFVEKVKEKMERDYILESDYRFVLDAREALIEKCDIALPEQFLKRWLYTANEGKFTMEEIEKEFHLFLKDFRWQLIRQYITREQKLEVTEEALLNHAKNVAYYQFSMYGLNNAPEEQIEHYAQSLLANEQEGRRMFEKVEDDLVIEYIKSVVTLDKKGITIEELRALTQ